MTTYPTITWVSAASPGYEADLARLVASTAILGADHRFEFHRTDRNVPWKLTDKFDYLRRALDHCETTHVFWIDADCEFTAPFTARDICGPGLTAVRHFGSTGPANYLPRHLLSRLGTAPHTGVSWQSCLFGGSVEGHLDAQLKRLEWMAAEGETYDEHGLVIDWSGVPPQMLLTLPCRWAAPTNFDHFPVEYRARYHERAGGLPMIIHHNRALNHRTEI